MKINSQITADPVWGLENIPDKTEHEGLKIGLQLRSWKSLKGKELYLIANDIVSIFNDVNTELELISLHPSEDFRVLERLSKILAQKGFKQKITLLSGLNSDEIVSHINNLDILITMRYHAGLVAAKCGVPFLALSYDPKVKNLAKTASMPFIATDELDFYRLDKAIKYLITEKNSLKEGLLKISAEKAAEAGKTVIYLEDALNKKDEFAKE